MTPVVQDQRKRDVRSAQTRLLYSNADTGTAVTVVLAPVLAYFQLPVVSDSIVLGWLVYTLVVAAARFVLTRCYWRAAENRANSRWSAAFAIGVGTAAAGWGAAGILLFPEARLLNQVFLVFVLGGMMLGGASLLAPRAESFIVFLLPTGLLPAIRLLAEGDQAHVTMGFLVALFTVATVSTTWRFHRTIESSLNLKFENRDLVEDLQIAKAQTDALNLQLERRVEERTAELHHTAERLRAEITQREQAEDELLRARKLESLGVLAGGIAHDFNNFLTVIQGHVELAQLQIDPSSPVHDILGGTVDVCRRAAHLSSQLLTFARGGSPVRRVVSVSKLILDAIKLARAGAAASISVAIAEDLWPAEVDANQIGQVLHNILLNAKQSMPEGGGIIEVRAENVVLSGDHKASSGAYVRVSITDYGTGISADIMPRIFDPYFTTKQDASGLGLATAYAIVAKHGGRVSVESKYGSGTTFIVDLPAAQSSPAKEPASVPRVEARSQRPIGKLLVMDDEEALRTLLVQFLVRFGHEVQSARDGAEAIDLYQAAQASGRRFDLVLLDLTVVSGMGGEETARSLKELDPSAKLIASSGYSDSPVMSSFRDYGFVDVLPKPWVVAELDEVVRRVLGDDTARRSSSDRTSSDAPPQEGPR